MLETKGLSYAYKGYLLLVVLTYTSAIHLRNNEQKSAEFTEISPGQAVPVLVVDGKPLFQSLAIIEWLEETYPEVPLLPKY